MAPSSHFLEGLFEVPLNDGLAHHLFFAFEGHRSRGTTGTNDGVVALASQLAPPAQEQATRRLGFAEDHSSILRSARAAAALNAALLDPEG
jgi:hypothetical protein